MKMQFSVNKYYELFDINAIRPCSFAIWIEAQGGKVICNNTRYDNNYFDFKKESDAVMFVLKWGVK